MEAIKKELMSTQEIDEDDINRETYLRIKEEYGPKSKDPFFAAFLETQLLNVFIFKYWYLFHLGLIHRVWTKKAEVSIVAGIA